MIDYRTVPIARIAALVLALALVLTAGGCAAKPDEGVGTTTGEPGSARAGYAVAESAVTEMAADAVLLVVQTAAPVAAEAAPIWVYTFGSPESGSMYSVTVATGAAMPATEVGSAPLSEAEWALVPGIDAWKVDSDAAYEKALEASEIADGVSAYEMIFETHVPESAAGAATKPLVWYVILTPTDTASAPVTVEVNAETGAAVVQ
jgi:hypothetical protein